MNNDGYPKQNSEGYEDPTPHRALDKVAREFDEIDVRYRRTIGLILGIINLGGFETGNRIQLVDKETGRRYL